MKLKNPIVRVTPEVKRLAVEVCLHYYLALRTAQMDAFARTISGLAFGPPPWDDLTKVDQRHFRRAADACIRLEADPRQYVIAQFQAWATFSQKLGRIMMPQPVHLSSLAAQARYVAYALARTERKTRTIAPPTSTKAFFREERKLKGMVSMLRVPPEDVLTEHPEEFTRAFLEHRQVWDLVADQWLAHADAA